MLFAQSPFFPFAVGLFGLGTCYFVWAGQSLFGWQNSEFTDRTTGLWGVWMGGFMQFITGVWLLTGMTWFQVFSYSAPAFMAGLAFTAYGVHWFVMGHRRYLRASAAPDAWMSIAFAWLSIIGVIVFLKASDIPVAIVFALLALAYLSELIGRFAGSAAFLKLQSGLQLLNALWLMYLTFAFTLNLASGFHFWV